jgi:hypothetical protein
MLDPDPDLQKMIADPLIFIKIYSSKRPRDNKTTTQTRYWYRYLLGQRAHRSVRREEGGAKTRGRVVQDQSFPGINGVANFI